MAHAEVVHAWCHLIDRLAYLDGYGVSDHVVPWRLSALPFDHSLVQDHFGGGGIRITHSERRLSRLSLNLRSPGTEAQGHESGISGRASAVDHQTVIATGLNARSTPRLQKRR